MDQNFFNIIEKKSGIKLNDGQKKAVLHAEGPALVLAVPGSGYHYINAQKLYTY